MIKLADRTYGFQFSGIEYELIFKSDDMGFVRYDGKSKTKFYLDPHPERKTDKNEVYIIEGCPAPDPRKLIRVLSMETEELITGKIQNKMQDFNRKLIKYVHSWEYVNPNKIKRRELLYYDEFVSFFSQPYNSQDYDYMIEPNAKALAIYTASSPVIGSNLKGGINSTVLTGDHKPLWNHTSYLLDFIPKEFKHTKSEMFYKYGEKEHIVNPVGSTEVNLAYNNAQQLVSQIPVCLLKMDVANKDSYSENYNHLLPFIVARNLDSLLFTPEIPANLQKHIEDRIYKIKETVESSIDHMAYNQDVSMALPKICASLARLHFEETVTKDHIKEAEDSWFEAFEHAVHMERICMHDNDVMKLHRFKAGSKTLYFYLLQNYGLDAIIPKEELYVKCPVPEYMLEDTIANLLNVGAVYAPDPDHIKLLDFRPPEWKKI